MYTDIHTLARVFPSLASVPDTYPIHLHTYSPTHAPTGQTRTVYVTRIVIKGSVEDRILELQQVRGGRESRGGFRDGKGEEGFRGKRFQGEEVSGGACSGGGV